MKCLINVVASTLLLVFGSSLALAAEFPKLQSPILLTSAGQSPDVNTVKVLANKAQLTNVTYKPMATANDLSGVKTLLVTVGVSHKGFGVAGTNLDTESARVNALLSAAKSNHIPVVVIHIGGVEGREALSQKILDVVAPKGDAFIVYVQGNGDGFFTKSAGGKPLILANKPMELVQIFSAHK